MLTVLRKYQKGFIIAIGLLIVASFLFYGVSGRMNQMPTKLPDPVVGKAVDGSDIHALHRDAVVRFISADCLDGHLSRVRQVPNFFNDGVIRKDLLETGVADLLGMRYFDAFKDDLERSLKRAKVFKTFTHPQMKHLKAESIWNQFAPGLLEQVSELKGMDFGHEVFKSLTSIYVGGKGLNGELVRQVLGYQAQNSQDPYLNQGDMSLIGAHSLSDWFGHAFLEKCASVIINGARLAEQKGYVVTREEAQADLWNNGFQFLSARKRGEEIKGAEVSEYLEKQLQLLQMTETMAVDVWRDVLLFRRLMDEAGGSLFVDPLAQEQFDSYANEGVALKCYRLPQMVRDYPTELALYLEKVSRSSKGLPAEPRNIDEIDGQLVEEVFKVRVASCYKPGLAQRVTLQETLAVELNAENWGELAKKCPTLPRNVASREERLNQLDRLSADERAIVDAHAREKIVDTHPEWITEALDDAPMSEQVLHVARSGDREPLEGITHLSAFAEMLKSEADSLKGFTDNQQHYYRIEVLEQSKGPQLLTFAQAVEAGALESMLNKKLEQAYKRVREQSPKTFQDDKGEWKKWYEVKHEIASRLYVEPMKTRLKEYLKEQQALVKSNAPALEGFGSQWELEVSSQVVRRAQSHPFLDDALMQKPAGWSEVFASKQGDPLFVNVEGSSDKAMPSSELTKAAHEILSCEVKAHAMNELLDLIDNV